MYSGLALLMDVHQPEKPNGYGVIFIAGSGWQAPLHYGAPGLKEAQINQWGPPLLRAGYTVFAINHRGAPRFHSDDTVPYQQSVALEAALRGVNVPVKLVRVAGGAHGSDFGTAGKPHPQFPEILAETVSVSWLDQYLKAAPPPK